MQHHTLGERRLEQLSFLHVACPQGSCFKLRCSPALGRPSPTPPTLVCRPLHAFHLGRGEPQGSNYHCTAAARQVLASESGVCPASAGDCAEGLPGWHDELTAGCALLQAARPAIRKIRCGQRFLTVMAAKPADAGAPCTATAFIVPLCQPCAWGSANSPPKPTLHRATYRLQCQCCCHAVEMSCMHLCRLTAVAPPAGRLAG